MPMCIKMNEHDSPAVVCAYIKSRRQGIFLFYALLLCLCALVVVAVRLGSYDMSVKTVVENLLHMGEGPESVVVWNIRMPRIVAGIVAGSGLGLAGLGTQSLLRNPLASPFTLGVSQGAGFGAACAIVGMGAWSTDTGFVADQLFSVLAVFGISRMYVVTFFAFIGAMAATLIILALSRSKKMSPRSVILAGVALASLFTSGTILVQYLASETEVASVVFWTFGDVARSGWSEIGGLAVALVGSVMFYLHKRWELNALLAGDDVATSLGVNVERLRMTGLLLASVLAALVTAFHGVIAFLGLLAPHIARLLAGSDHRILIPFSCLVGALCLVAADTLGRVVVGSGSLPVGVLTSFLGAPLFLMLLVRSGDG